MQSKMLVEEPPIHRPVVLVVDDEFLIRAATAEGLRNQGFEVLEAGSADEAMTILGAIHVDAVFSDITMPGNLDGIGLAQWTRQHKPGLKVVLTSGTLYLPRELASLGPVVDKPYRLEDVVDRLRAEIGHRPSN